MYHDPIERRRKIQLTLTVLAVGIIISALLAIGLVYLGRTHPRTAWSAPKGGPELAAYDLGARRSYIPIIW